MKAISVYLTEKERSALIDAANRYVEMMSDGEETAEAVCKELDDGLGSALFKLYKGLNGAFLYKDYKAKRGEKQ